MEQKMDYISAADMEYRTAMERGSQQLLQAIKWARKGYNPATSQNALKLPPDWSQREQRVIEIKKRAKPRPCNDRVREMMERGMEAKDIAREMKANVRKISWIMKAIKLQRRRDDFDERIHQSLWG
jgi:hypothetical protein